MIFFIVKAAISGIIVATVSGIGISYPRIGAVLGTLPIVTILTFLVLVFVENADRIALVNLSSSIAYMALVTVVYPATLYGLLRYTELDTVLAILFSLIPLMTGYRIMYLFLS